MIFETKLKKYISLFENFKFINLKIKEDLRDLS